MSPFLLGFGLFGVLIHGEVISILNNVLVCLFTFTFVLDKVDESVFKSAKHSASHMYVTLGFGL